MAKSDAANATAPLMLLLLYNSARTIGNSIPAKNADAYIALADSPGDFPDAAFDSVKHTTPFRSIRAAAVYKSLELIA